MVPFAPFVTPAATVHPTARSAAKKMGSAIILKPPTWDVPLYAANFLKKYYLFIVVSSIFVLPRAIKIPLIALLTGCGFMVIKELFPFMVILGREWLQTVERERLYRMEVRKRSLEYEMYP